MRTRSIIRNTCVHRTTKCMRWWFQRFSAGKFPYVYSLPRETRSPAFLPLAHLARLTEYDTTWLLDEMCVPDGCCVERNAARSASPRREDGAKTSFERLFRGKVFRDDSTRFERTNERMNATRSWILDYILARRCSWSYLTIKKGFIVLSKVPLYDWNAIRCS